MCTDQVELFGFRYDIRSGMLTPGKAPAQKIEIFDRPSDRKSLKGFLGQVLYFGYVAEGLSQHLATLYPLTSLNSKFEWQEEHEIAFQQIKECIRNTQGIFIMGFDPKENHKLHVYCDASPLAVGGKITAVSPVDSVVRPLYFFHTCTSQARQRRPQYYRELLGLAELLLKSTFLLAGCHFFLHSDSLSLLLGYKYASV